jgi:hypothetical protein
MINSKALEQKLDWIKESAKKHDKNFDHLKIRRESGRYTVAIYFSGGAYHQFSPYMSGKELYIWLDGFGEGITQ